MIVLPPANGASQVAENAREDGPLLLGIRGRVVGLLELEVAQDDPARAARIVHQAADVEHRLDLVVEVVGPLREQPDVVQARHLALARDHLPLGQTHRDRLPRVPRRDRERLRIVVRLHREEDLILPVEQQAELRHRIVERVADPLDLADLLRSGQDELEIERRLIGRGHVDDVLPAVGRDHAVGHHLHEVVLELRERRDVVEDRPRS